MKILLLGPWWHPALLSSLTLVFREHTFYITGPEINPRSLMQPIGSNLKVIEAQEKLTQKRLDDFDILIDYPEGKYFPYLEKWSIPKIWFAWYCFGKQIKPIIKENEPLVYTSFTTRNDSIQEAKRINSYGEYIKGPVVYPYRDPSIFKDYKGKEKFGLMVVNNFWKRKSFGAEFYNQLLKLDKNISIKIIGDYSLNFQDLLETYQNNRVFLELTTKGRPSTSTMGEAMTVGMPIIATSLGDFPLIIRNFKEGFVSSNPKDVLKSLNLLIKDKDLSLELGRNSRLRALDTSGETQFRQGFEEAFLFALEGESWSIDQNLRMKYLRE